MVGNAASVTTPPDVVAAKRIVYLLGGLFMSMCLSAVTPALGKDYIVTLAGGYSPKGNQASLEANVLFFEQVLARVYHQPIEHTIFFADGDDPSADVQYSVTPEQSGQPATDLLRQILGGGRSSPRVAYRNHEIEAVHDRLHPTPIRARLEELSRRMDAGDRLLLYVTAHGSAGREEDPFNTTIDCWDDRRITARQLGKWLDKLPPDCAVVMVMAQCYCGGFARTVFKDLEVDRGPATPLRIGFFAQQHDRAAAGCRPDISNDREFSSYFWGALVGHTRNGHRMVDGDIDGDGRISLAEAFAVALVTCDTIDVPLRTSDVVLRSYSRIPDYELPGQNTGDEKQRLSKALRELASDGSVEGVPPAPDSSSETSAKNVAGDEAPPSVEDASEADNSAAAGLDRLADQPELARLEGSIESLIEGVSPELAFAVRGLCEQTEVSGAESFEQFVSRVARLREEVRQARRGRYRSRGRSSARRELSRQILEAWPELKDQKAWPELEILAADNQQQVLAAIQKLAGWSAYQEERDRRAAELRRTADLELRLTKMERLRFLLESIVLDRNFPKVAPAEACELLNRIRALEQSSLGDAELARSRDRTPSDSDLGSKSSE